MRIRYADLAPINPRIVCCLLTGFGMTGPQRAEPAYDYILQGMAGWMDMAGEPGGPPTKTGLSMVDYSGGLVAAISLLAAVHAARRDGVGCECDVSLFDTAVSLINYPATWNLTAGYVPAPHAALRPSLARPVPELPDRRRLDRGRLPEGEVLAAADRGARPPRPRDRRALRDLRRPSAQRGDADRDPRRVLRRAHDAEWLEALAAAGVPSGPVNTVEQALADPQTAARELIVETEHPRWGTVRQLASPVRVGAERPSYRRAPRRNEDADHVLRTVLGYDSARIEQLGAAGAFGSG